MNCDDLALERLKELFWKSPFVFLVIYRGNVTGVGIEFRWCRAISPTDMTHDQYDALAAYYYDVALECFQSRCDLILNETIKSTGAEVQRWCGLDVVTGANGRPTPANSLGQRWWHVVIASGAVHAAGYVVVARIAAKDAGEVDQLITKVQEIMWEFGEFGGHGT
jgi:hypothetical protein